MRTIVVASLILLAGPLCLAQSLSPAGTTAGPTSIPKKPVSFDLSAIDKTVDPCVDFYQYACGNWRKDNPIPADQVRWGRFNQLSDYNNYLLYTDLKKAADDPQTRLQKKYGNYFAACMDEDRVNQLGARPLQPELDLINSLESTKGLAALNVAMSRRFGGPELLGVGVEQDQKDSSRQILATGQGGLTLPDRDYYLSQEARMRTIRKEYVEHMQKMFGLLGDTPEQAATEAAAVLKIETALAQGSMTRVERRNPDNTYHVMTIAEVSKLSPAYDWKQYLDGIGLSKATGLNVSSPHFVDAVNQQLESEPLSAIKSYLRWHAVHGAAPWLSKPFAEENFDFFSRTLQGQKQDQPRWKRCTRATDMALGEAVGQDWVKQNFPPAAKDNTEQMVKALEAALAQDIQQLPWMSDATKAQAKLKLDAIRDKIGYPSHWRNYSKLAVKRDDLLGNLQRNAVFERNRNLSKYGKPVDETEWGMTPPTVNAYYNPSMNDINFPAGILQPPFYDFSKDPAVNFGGIGVVIGHEMTHGFDDEGAKYDLHGNVRVWWTPDDLAKFKQRTECEAKEYDGFEVAPGQNLNGHLTLGENTADNGGLRIAFQALMQTLAQEGAQAGDKTVDGYTPAQRFFISFGQVWCENRTEQSARVAAKVDPHSSGRWRTNGTVQNFDAFGKAFGCHKGQPMMPADGGCRVW
ncbi:MAG TPA: M13 family metallopeptidase [Acidobacteriaceae bacterium]|jgi:putative endopeptidase|nr:M13 family metallopeptidase [Acidobacteriaceae bacterium]